MANHVKPENLQGNLPQYSHVHFYTLKPRSRGQDKTLKTTLLHIWKTFCEYTLHLLGWNFSLAFLVSELSPPSHLHLPSISFQRLLERSSGPTPKHLSTCPTPLMSQKSRTPLVHHFTPFSFTVSRPGATDPRAKNQALAPSVPISFQSKSMFVNVLLTFNASAMACGQQGWQTMWNLRTYKAICHNIAMSTTTHWSLDHEVKIKRLKDIAPYL